jgi:hypothetical protein
MKSKSAMQKIQDTYFNVSQNASTMWFRAILQSLDVEFNSTVGIKISVGQFLERFLFTQADLIAQKRTEEAIQELNSNLKKIKLDQKMLKKNVEEYAKLFIRFCGMISSQSFGELRKAYVNQMSHFFEIEYSKEQNKLFYQQLLFKLTIDHLYILKFANKFLGEEPGKIHENSKTLNQEIENKFVNKGMDKALVRGFIKDLESNGLLNATQTSLWGGDLNQLYLSELGRKLLSQVEKGK